MRAEHLLSEKTFQDQVETLRQTAPRACRGQAALRGMQASLMEEKVESRSKKPEMAHQDFVCPLAIHRTRHYDEVLKSRPGRSKSAVVASIDAMLISEMKMGRSRLRFERAFMAQQ